MSTLVNKKLELFDTGAGSSQPMAEENVQLASGKIFLLIILILGNIFYLLHEGLRNIFHL